MSHALHITLDLLKKKKKRTTKRNKTPNPNSSYSSNPARGCNREPGGDAEAEGERRPRVHLNAVNRPAHRTEHWCNCPGRRRGVRKGNIWALLPSSVRLLKAGPAGKEIFHGNPVWEEGEGWSLSASEKGFYLPLLTT